MSQTRKGYGMDIPENRHEKHVAMQERLRGECPREPAGVAAGMRERLRGERPREPAGVAVGMQGRLRGEHPREPARRHETDECRNATDPIASWGG